MNEESKLVGVTGLVDVTTTEAELGLDRRAVLEPRVRHGRRAPSGPICLRGGGPGARVRPSAGAQSPSRRVLEKLGFQFQQTETHEHPKWTDADRFARYRIDRSAWSATG